MEEKNTIIFRELLTEVKELADKSGGTLTKEEVDLFFASAQLLPEQMELIYDYLRGQGIRVKGAGFAKSSHTGAGRTQPESRSEGDGGASDKSSEADIDADAEEDDEEDPMKLYLRDINELPDLLPEEEKHLFDRAARGDVEARRQLACAYLGMVIDLAAEYEDMAAAEDLIQEGNMALLIALENLESEETLSGYQVKLVNEISASLRKAAEDMTADRRGDETVSEKVRRIHAAAEQLEEELGHPVSVEELSAFLEMPAAEIRDIIRLAGEV